MMLSAPQTVGDYLSLIGFLAIVLFGMAYITFEWWKEG